MTATGASSDRDKTHEEIKNASLVHAQDNQAAMTAGHSSAFSPSQDQDSGFRPVTNIEKVLEDEIKEWHFHIYFHQKNEQETKEALELRDAILRLRHAGAFVAVPLWRVNEWPMGPHPVGSYEVWCPSESFAAVFSYLCQNHGNLSVLIHPLTRHERLDHSHRNAWIGSPFPLDLSTLPTYSKDIPLQYPTLGLGYSSHRHAPSIEQRRREGESLEKRLEREPEAAPAPDAQRAEDRRE